MMSPVLEQLNTEIQQLSLAEQVWLLEQLAHMIHVRTLRQQQLLEDQLTLMASDPQLQRELQAIELEFAGTENDGLADEARE